MVSYSLAMHTPFRRVCAGMGVRVSDALGGCQVASSCGSAAVRRAALCSAVAGLLLSACADTHSSPGQAGDPQREGDAELQRAETCPQPRGCRGTSAGQGAAARPSPSLRHALQLAPHRGRGDADYSPRSCGSCSKTPRLTRRGRRRAARGRKEGGRDHLHRQADRRQLEEPRRRSRAALHLQDRREVAQRSPPSCASAARAGEHYSTVSDLAAQNATTINETNPRWTWTTTKPRDWFLE